MGCIITHVESLCLGNIKTVSDDARVQALGNVSVGLLQQLSHQQHYRRGAVSANVVLRSRCSGNHDGRRVLDLHLSEENVAVFGQFELGKLAKLVMNVVRRVEVPVLHRRRACKWSATKRNMIDSDTHILIVPRGPRFDLSTSCRPSPALMLTLRASPLLCAGS
jgi:hypothetical protein